WIYFLDACCKDVKSCDKILITSPGLFLKFLSYFVPFGFKLQIMTVKERVASLRKEMKENNIEAFIVYYADPHMSEYLPDEWQERTWISGFTGSAGFVVVTMDKAGLWTDGRYFTQGPVELEGSGIDLFKDGVEGTPNYVDWIISQTSENAKVAVNALATSNAN